MEFLLNRKCRTCLKEQEIKISLQKHPIITKDKKQTMIKLKVKGMISHRLCWYL